MNIGFDISQTGSGKAGCGYFADSLIRKLSELDTQNAYILYMAFGNRFFDPLVSQTATKITKAAFRLGPRCDSLADARRFWRSEPTALWKSLGSPEIVHSNNFFCPILPPQVRLVYTLYDLSFLRHPEFTTEANRLVCFDGMFQAALRADAFIAISTCTRDHFLKVFPHVPQSRMHLVSPGSRFADLPRIPSRPQTLPILEQRRFWLSVATIEPRKNHLRLLKAFARLLHNRPNTPPLVLSGGDGWMMSHFQDTIAALGLGNHVILTGYVDDPSLQWLYENCLCFVYPSLFEGFGLPVLEAMSCGAPVITSSSSSLPEIVGDAGILIDPRSAEEITAVMASIDAGRVSADALSKAARQRSNLFSWERAARNVLSIYDAVAALETK